MHAQTTTILLLLFILALPTYGQHTDLSASKVYKQNSLSVDLSGLQVENAFGNDLKLACTTCWNPYQGYERLKESEFFEIAGYEQLAQQAQRSRRNKFIGIGIGGLSMIAGGVLLADNFSNAGFEGPNVGATLAGVLLLGGGGATVGFSAVKLHTRSVPYEIARDVAIDYNSQLLEELDRQ